MDKTIKSTAVEDKTLTQGSGEIMQKAAFWTDARGAVGKYTLVTFKDIQIKCKVKAFKYTFGHERYLIEPVEGTGEMWIDAKHVGKLVNR